MTARRMLGWGMTAQDDTESPTEKLAKLVERRKADAARTSQGVPGRQSAERSAAARSAAKSKPAPRKG